MVRSPHTADRPYTIDDIVKFAGGSNEVANRLSVSSRATWQWKKGDWPGIRDHYWDALIELASAHSGVTLTAQDFFEANKMARAAALGGTSQPTAAE